MGNKNRYGWRPQHLNIILYLFSNMETWKTIPFETDFEVSDLGRVRYKNSSWYPNQEIVKGHLQVSIPKRYYVHRLVLQTFRPNPKKSLYDMVDHINQNRSDNKLSNLRWSNNSLNQLNRKNVKGYKTMPNGKFQASITVLGNRMTLGTFATKEEARNAYVEARERAFEVYDEYNI